VIPEHELDRLHALPLGEFTRARDALARDLRKAGEPEVADEVKALAKPPLSAWAVNQLARTEALQMRALMTAGERLRKAQADLLGGGEPEELQAALQRQRDVIGALLGSAERILLNAGHPATNATLERVRGTLTAAAMNEGDAELVARGRLGQDLEPAGFGGVAAAPPKAARRPPARQKRKDDEDRRRRVDEAKRKFDDLRAEVAEQRDHARRAASEARRAQAELNRLIARLDAAKDELARARSSPAPKRAR
jgi:hypothetical protein